MNTSLGRVLCISLCLLVFIGAQLAGAQDARGLITGIISDSSGAVVNGAKVTATADATGVVTSTSTNEAGNYALLYLIPGMYTVTVEQTGFRKLEQKNVQVTVGGEFKLNLQLLLGNVETAVTVNEEPPAIETQTADVGVTMTNRQIADLPLSDGNPFTLTRMVPGAVFTGSPLYARPFDNSDVSALTVNGSEPGINFGLNGAPNTGHQNGHNESVLSFMPPADAMDEFKMTTSTYTASSGHTSAASVNVKTKSGTNKFHGSLSAQNRNEIFAAMNFFDNDNGRPKPVMRLQHYTGTIGGPVDIPKIYNGKNKTFFFFATDHMLDSFPSQSYVTVPSLAEKGMDANHNPLGYYDFSAMCKSGFSDTSASSINAPITGVTYQGLCNDRASDGKTPLGSIWNPFTTVYQSGSTSNVTRMNFPNDRIPASMINPIAAKVLGFFPDPNTPGNADGTNNFYTQNPRNDYFHSYMGSVDHILSEKQSFHFNYQQNWRKEHRDNPLGVVTNPVLNVTMPPLGNDLYYTNKGGQLGDTVTLSSNSVLDLRVGISQFRDKRRPQVLGLDPATLGLPTNATDQIKAATGVENYLPYFYIYGFQKIGNTNSRYMDDISTTTFFTSQLNKMVGRHMFSFGYEGRVVQENQYSLGDPMGYYEFRQNYAEQTNSSSPGAEQGQGLATFLLGLPYNNSDRVTWNGTSANSRLFHALYAQDDWKVGSKLTLNLGLRWELEGAPTERYNRNTLRFDPTASLPDAAAAQSAFGANPAFPGGTFTFGPTACPNSQPCPLSSITIPSFNVTGGYLYTSPANRQFYHASLLNFQPRFGFAYAVDPKTVLRGGVGLYSAPLLSTDGNNGNPGYNQDGYSLTTNAPYTTQNNGLNLNPENCLANSALCSGTYATLSNPFPLGAKQPYGNTFGSETNWGSSIDFSPLPAFGDPKIQRSLAWSFDIQQELPDKWTLTLSYAGRKSWDVARKSNYLNALPEKYFTPDQINDPYMQAWNSMMSSSSIASSLINPSTGKGYSIGDPFYGVGGANNSRLSTSNLSLQQLLRPFPQYGDITTSLYVGGNFYNGATVMLDHRFSHGYQLFFTYTRSKAMEDNGFLNDWEITPQHRLSINDVPNRITGTFIGQVPVGHGRAFGSNLPKWLDGIVGGWQTGVVYMYQTGLLIDLNSKLGDFYYNGDISKLSVNYDPMNIAHGNGYNATTGLPYYGDVFNVSGFYPTGGASCASQQKDSSLKAACYGDALNQLSAYHIRTAPFVMGNLRRDGINNWDINAIKKFRIKEGLTYELRADFLNALNHPQFETPNTDPTASNFGTVTSQRNLPRTVQIGMKLLF